MSQYKTGTATVTNGSPTVTGTNTLWLANVTAGDSFTVAGDGVMYYVASVDSDTQITLSVAYAGVTASGVVYAIGTGFTVPDSFPEMSQGDIETATIFTRAMRKIQGKFTGIAINTTAEIGQAVSDHEATNDHPLATTSAKGFLSGADKTKIDTVEDGATADQTKADIDALNIDADTLDGIDSLGFDAAGAADTAVSDHVALPDPHSQYADQATTYTETEVDNLLDDKADKATTYTETEVDGLLNTKADQANTYTETEVDELTGSLAYPNTTLASSSDISESLKSPITAYPHIQGFRTGTGTALTFAQAVEEAAERGARLLTIQELEAGVAAATGYSYGSEITWTSSPAGVGLVYGNLGDGNGTRVVLNTNTDTAAGGYAVSVIGQRQWTDTRYAEIAGGAAANFTAMPQVGGDPIVESGSNSDGEFTKWADGTMICFMSENISDTDVNTATGGLFVSAQLSWTHPVVFVGDRPTISLGGGGGFSNGTGFLGQALATLTTTNYYVVSAISGTNVNPPISITTIGRWK